MTETLGNLASLGYFGPELALMGAALLVIIWDLLVKERRTRVLGAAALCLAALEGKLDSVTTEWDERPALGVVLVHSQDGNLTALDARTGRAIWMSSAVRCTCGVPRSSGHSSSALWAIHSGRRATSHVGG